MFPWFCTQKSIFVLYFTRKLTISWLSRACSLYEVIVTSYIYWWYLLWHQWKDDIQGYRTFHIDHRKGVATTPFGKYVWEKCSGELGIISFSPIWNIVENPCGNNLKSKMNKCRWKPLPKFRQKYSSNLFLCQEDIHCQVPTTMGVQFIQFQFGCDVSPVSDQFLACVLVHLFCAQVYMLYVEI